MATAELDIRIRSGDVPNATRELKRLESQGLSTERGMGSLASASKKTGSAIEALSGALAGVGFVVAARDAMALADKFNTLEARVNRLGGTAAESSAIWKELTNVTAETGGELSATIALWESLDQSVNATDAQITTLVGTLQKLGKIGGSSSEEMSNAMRQLGQSFAGGIVRAEEFNSVLEQTPEIWRRVAKEQGISLGELRTKMLEGKLTADEVFNALINQTSKVNADFEKMPRTVEAASAALQTRFGQAIASIDKEIGASKYFAKLLDGIAKGIEVTFDVEMKEQARFNELMEQQVKLKESIYQTKMYSPASTKQIELMEERLKSIRAEMSAIQDAKKQRTIDESSGKTSAAEQPRSNAGISVVPSGDVKQASQVASAATDAARIAYDTKIAALAREQQAEADDYNRRLQAAGEFNARMDALDATALEKAANDRGQRMIENQMYFNNGLITEEQYQINLTAIKSKYTDERIAIEENELRAKQMLQSSMLGSASGFFDGMAGMAEAAAGEQSGIYRATFALSKGFATAKAALDMQMAISDAMSKGFPQNIPLMAQAASAGAQIASTIGGLNYSGAYDKGGYIPAGSFGVGSEKRDEFINGVLVKGPARITGGAQTEKKIEAAANGGGGDMYVTINQTIQGNGDQVLAEVVDRATKNALNEVQRDFATNGRIRKTAGI